MKDLNAHFESRIEELLVAANSTEFTHKKRWLLGLIKLNKELSNGVSGIKKGKKYYKAKGKYFSTVQELADYLNVSLTVATRFVKQRKTDKGEMINIVSLPTGVTFDEFYT